MQDHAVLQDHPDKQQWPAGWEAAYQRHGLDQEQLAAAVAELKEQEQAAHASFQQLLQQLLVKQGYATNSNTISQETEWLAACIGSRLSTNNYPSQPTVSLILQFYQRTAAIPKLVTSFLACNSTELPTELLVNVDSQEGADVSTSHALLLPDFAKCTSRVPGSAQATCSGHIDQSCLRCPGLI